MLRSMYSGISGMKVNQAKLDVIGNNIANVGTTGFKSSSARFKDMLYQNAGEATSPTATKGGTNAKQVGLGAQLSSINKVMGQGNALSTGRSLDVCVDGDGYLMVAKGNIEGNIVVDTANSNAIGTGGTMDETLYTRDGNLTLDENGNLLTADGYRVMGYYTATSPLTLNTTTGALDATYEDADTATFTSGELRPLAIPDSVTDASGNQQAVKKFQIGKDGVITAILGDGTISALGQIAMASFKNPEGLTGIGGNLYEVSSNSGDAIIRSESKTTGTDNSGGYGDIIQGCLEGSNVDLTEQFTDMITATRSFQAAGKMITTGDEILQTITGLMR